MPERGHPHVFKTKTTTGKSPGCLLLSANPMKNLSKSARRREAKKLEKLSTKVPDFAPAEPSLCLRRDALKGKHLFFSGCQDGLPQNLQPLFTKQWDRWKEELCVGWAMAWHTFCCQEDKKL
jgi:hypothetical protein